MDQRQNCGEQAKNGGCESEDMKTFCPESCNICGLGKFWKLLSFKKLKI
jgi:hypothetical protein